MRVNKAAACIRDIHTAINNNETLCPVHDRSIHHEWSREELDALTITALVGGLLLIVSAVI